MATEHTFVFDRSFQASTDLSSNQFYIVSSSAADVVDLCVASSGTIAVVRRPYGILQNNPTSGGAATVRRLGLSKVVASSSGSITVGTLVACSTAGTAMVATSGCYVLGTAMTASSGVTGQLIEVELLGPFSYPTATST